MDPTPLILALSITSTTLAIINKIFAIRTGRTLVQLIVSQGSKKLTQKKIIVLDDFDTNEIDISQRIIDLINVSNK
jgi:hypothetical protein